MKDITGWTKIVNSNGLKGLLLLVLLLGTAQAQVLVPAGASWSYLDDGSNQSVMWQLDGVFDDSGWDTGAAPLGFGNGNEATVVAAAPVTIYFRHAFNVNDPALYNSLTIRLRRDDGAVVYLNGTEIARSNMPDCNITSTTRALSAVNGSDELTFFEHAVISPTLLHSGSNVIAVEVHQANTTGNELIFDLELIANDTGNTNTPPTISLTAPAQNAVFKTGTDIAIAALAEDSDGIISQVEFRADGAVIATDTDTPYQFTWTGAATGAHTLSAIAYDDGGLNTVSAAITITVVANTPPAVTITAPAGGALFRTGATIDIQASASDGDGTVARVDFFAGAQLIGSAATAPYSTAWQNVAAGNYALTAVAYDNDNVSTTSAAVNISVANPVNSPPTISFNPPQPGALIIAGTQVVIIASATDPDGNIVRVEFLVDGILLTSDTTAPYSAVWPAVDLGSHDLTAIAYDNDGNSTSVQITVSVTAPDDLIFQNNFE
jgi:hypothetical protein